MTAEPTASGKTPVPTEATVPTPAAATRQGGRWYMAQGNDRHGDGSQDDTMAHGMDPRTNGRQAPVPVEPCQTTAP